jgi:hypothetical protein
MQKDALANQQAAMEDALDNQIQALRDEFDARKTATQEAYDMQRDFLNKEADDFDAAIDVKLTSLEALYQIAKASLEKQLDAIKKSLQEQIDALKEFLKGHKNAIQQFVIDAWQAAIDKANEYANAAAAALAGKTTDENENSSNSDAGRDDNIYNRDLDFDNNGTVGQNDYQQSRFTNGRLYYRNKRWPSNEIDETAYRALPAHHSGGIVGGLPKIPEAETFARLLKGEYVSNNQQMANFINRTLPSIANMNNNNGDVSVPMTFNVAGNLDKTVLPELKNMIMTTVNAAISNRGIRRNANAFSL